jgi:hypothetical protein
VLEQQLQRAVDSAVEQFRDCIHGLLTARYPHLLFWEQSICAKENWWSKGRSLLDSWGPVLASLPVDLGVGKGGGGMPRCPSCGETHQAGRSAEDVEDARVLEVVQATGSFWLHVPTADPFSVCKVCDGLHETCDYGKFSTSRPLLERTQCTCGRILGSACRTAHLPGRKM